MPNLIDLLDPAHDGHSLRHALVHLWVDATGPRLNAWEQAENEQTITPHQRRLLADLEHERAISAGDIDRHPIALIRALDEHLAAETQDSAALITPNEVTGYRVHAHDYWLVPVSLAARGKARTATQAQRRCRWFKHHAVLPQITPHGVKVRLHAARSTLDDRLVQLRLQRQELGVWIAHFRDGADVRWTQEFSPVGNWRATHVAPHETRVESLQSTLASARASLAQALVFPEFAIDLEQRKVVQRYLRQSESEPNGPLLLVAGSFHAPADPHTQTVYNEAPVYGPGGRLLFAHRKLRLFGEAEGGTEHAAVGDEFHVLLTPIGCMAVLICKDFIDDEASVCSLLKEVPIDWVWVPSFGNATTLKLHQARARALACVTPGTSVAVAQTKNSFAEPKGDDLPGFGHPAGVKEPTKVGIDGGRVSFPLEFNATSTGNAAPKRPKLQVVPGGKS